MHDRKFHHHACVVMVSRRRFGTQKRPPLAVVGE
jgi:hypothetical protein